MLIRTGGANGATTTDAASGFGFALFLGKRFFLFGPIRARPNLGLVLQNGLSFVVQPIQLSVMF
jgi:hypothetical protein